MSDTCAGIPGTAGQVLHLRIRKWRKRLVSSSQQYVCGKELQRVLRTQVQEPALRWVVYQRPSWWILGMRLCMFEKPTKYFRYITQRKKIQPLLKKITLQFFRKKIQSVPFVLGTSSYPGTSATLLPSATPNALKIASHLW